MQIKNKGVAGYIEHCLPVHLYYRETTEIPATSFHLVQISHKAEDTSNI